MKMLERQPEVHPNLNEITQSLHALSEIQRQNQQSYQEYQVIIINCDFSRSIVLLNIKEITNLASAVLNEEEVKVDQIIGDLKAQFIYCIEKFCILPTSITFSYERQCARSDDHDDARESECVKLSNSYQEEIHRAQEEMARNIEFYYLLSLTNPTEEHIDKLSEMMTAQDFVEYILLGVDVISTPLILMCRNNQNGNLNRCIKLLEHPPTLENISNQIRRERNLELFDNSQRTDRIGYNAPHYICMNYHRDGFLEIFHQLTSTTFGFDVNFTDHTNFGRNALQLLFRSKKRNDLIHIVRAFICRKRNQFEISEQKRLDGSSLPVPPLQP